MTLLPPSRIPVIIGIGEVKDRPADPAQGLEPMALMAEALRRAEADAGASLLPRLPALDAARPERQAAHPRIPCGAGAAARHRHADPGLSALRERHPGGLGPDA